MFRDDTGPGEAQVAIVGGGFSGMAAVIKLREAGIDDVVLFEKAGELGGTWRENTYPGCACDVPSVLYSYSFEPKPDWTHVFARQPEIQGYALETAAKYRVDEATRFGTEVTAAEWDADTQRWRLQTTAGPFSARALIAAGGPLHKPKLPEVPGIGDFQGKMFHSAEWDHEHTLDGARVAVVGTGASAIQFVPKIQPQVGRMHLFQRTAPWVLPKPDWRRSGLEKRLMGSLPGAHRAVRTGLFRTLELLQFAQRHPWAMSQIQRIGLLHLRRQVADPELRAALTPEFVLGCKRLLLSNTYYPAIQQPNVELVPHGVTEIRANSIVGADGVEREVDTIIFGTGFTATDHPTAELVRRDDGTSLADLWQRSPQAYIGTTISGFPNLFFLIGPNTGNGHSSAIYLIESQLNYVVDALRTMRREGLSSVDVRPDAQETWNERVQEALAGTVWNSGGCQSYYIDANGRNSSIYPWTALDLRRRTASFDLENYLTRRESDVEVAAESA